MRRSSRPKPSIAACTPSSRGVATGRSTKSASALAGSNAALGVVPAGSGNGFARELGLPARPAQRSTCALLRPRASDRCRRVERPRCSSTLPASASTGDRRAVQRACEQGKRGMGPYLRIGLRETFRYRRSPMDTISNGERFHPNALLIAFANGREYGNRVVHRTACACSTMGGWRPSWWSDRHPMARLWGSRHVLRGGAERAPGMTFRSIQTRRSRAQPGRCHSMWTASTASAGRDGENTAGLSACHDTRRKGEIQMSDPAVLIEAIEDRAITKRSAVSLRESPRLATARLPSGE